MPSRRTNYPACKAAAEEGYYMSINLQSLIPLGITVLLWLLACYYVYNIKFEDVEEDE